MSIEEQLQPLIAKAIEAAEKTGEFVVEQAPELLQQFYKWQIIESILNIVFGLVVLFICVFIIKWATKAVKDYDTELLGGAALVTSSILFIIFVIVFFDGIYSLVEIIVAPKLYLIEYFLKT